MPLTPYSVHDLAEAVLGCVCAALDTTAEEIPGQPGCPCRVCVVPGLSAWDGCDEEEGCGQPEGGAHGQLTVSVARIFPSGQSFPTEDRTSNDSADAPRRPSPPWSWWSPSSGAHR